MTLSPLSRNALAVPPVEISSTPASARVRAKGNSPVLSNTERSARWILAITKNKFPVEQSCVNAKPGPISAFGGQQQDYPQDQGVQGSFPSADRKIEADSWKGVALARWFDGAIARG